MKMRGRMICLERDTQSFTSDDPNSLKRSNRKGSRKQCKMNLRSFPACSGSNIHNLSADTDRMFFFLLRSYHYEILDLDVESLHARLVVDHQRQRKPQPKLSKFGTRDGHG